MGNLSQKKKQQKQLKSFQQDQIQQKNQIDSLNNYKGYKNAGSILIGTNDSGLRLLNIKEEDKQKKVVAVIVTFCSGATYDHLFQTVEQKSLEGTKVEVYACASSYLPNLISAFEEKPKDDTAIKLMQSIKEVDKDCVVFNWQCSSGYSSKSFPEGQNYLFKFLKMVVGNGHMAMFSDFSLKALVSSWKEKYGIGPNPFVQTREHTGDFQIKFNPSDLKECPSAQLQIVGEMAENGTCKVLAAGGTIVYCVDSKKTKNDHYDLQVLSVVPTIKPPKAELSSKIGQNEGSAGHILLKYKSGGMILTSMGHWVQLMKIDTSPMKLFEVAERQYGSSYASKMKKDYESMDEVSQKCYVQSKARDFVRNQAPCSNMNKKANIKFKG